MSYGRFSEQALSTTGTTVLVQNGRDARGIRAWFFLRVPGAKLQALLTRISAGNADLRQYGEILASGYGTTPPERVTERMQRVFGFSGQVA